MGLLAPEYLRPLPPLGHARQQFVDIVGGVSMGLAIFAFSQAFRQTWLACRRVGWKTWRDIYRRYLYHVLTWLELSSCAGLSIVSWLYLNRVVDQR